MNTNLVAAAAFAAALAAPVIVLAAAAPVDADAPQVVVNFADINTATPAGQAALKSRVDHAAIVVCGGKPDTLQDVAAAQRFRACTTRAVAAAVAQIPTPRKVAGAPNPNG
jgi:UrcA family protein